MVSCIAMTNQRKTSLFQWLLGSASVLAVAVCSVACSHFFFQPDREVYLTPEMIPFEVDVAQVGVVSGEYIPLWWLRGEARSQRSCVVLQVHGNGQNMTAHVNFGKWFVEGGFDFVTFDYRGYGTAPGHPSRGRAVEDTAAVIRWVAEKSVEEGRQVLVLGQSLGGALAIEAIVGVLAKEEQGRLRLVILDSTFSSYRDMARKVLGRFWLTWPLQVPLSWLVADGVPPRDFAKNLHLPVLQVHATGDPIVPESEGRKLHEFLVGAEMPRRYVTFPGTTHLGAFSRPEAVAVGAFWEMLGEDCKVRLSER